MSRNPSTWHEWHPYYKWGYEGKDEAQLIQAAGSYANNVNKWRGNPLAISEWSMGVYEQFAPFNNTAQYQQFGQTMLQSFAGARGGYFFWSWSHSDDKYNIRTGWSMRGLLRNGILRI